MGAGHSLTQSLTGVPPALVRSRATWLLYAVNGVSAFFVYSVGPATPLIAGDLGVTPQVAALHGTAMAAAIAAVAANAPLADAHPDFAPTVLTEASAVPRPGQRWRSRPRPPARLARRGVPPVVWVVMLGVSAAAGAKFAVNY